jgi:patatin-like phospholipase/acyl hydrolase
MSAAPDSTKILSIDGGGIRGLIPALVLDRIEQKTGRSTADLFDVIAGTSTGGILALGLTCTGETGRPRYSAAELADMYVNDGATIFPHEIFAQERQLLGPKYPSTGREKALTEKLGDARLRDTFEDVEVIVTSYDIERRAPVFFRSAIARQSTEYDFLARDVALATSAAPTYFAPVRLPAPDPQPAYALVDGGVFANNPGMCAFVDDTTVKGESDGTLMVSLGTGVLTRRLPYEDAKGWGLIEWAPRVLDVVFDGVSDTVDYQLKTILGERYHRLQVTLETASDNMDDAGARNIEDLKLEAEELLEASAGELDRICAKLTA